MVSSFPKMQKSSASFSQSIRNRLRLKTFKRKHGNESLSQRIRTEETVCFGRPFCCLKVSKNFFKNFQKFCDQLC